MNTKSQLATKNKSKIKTLAFICFVGIDGAGKTTLARAFNEKQQQTRQIEYRYFDGGAYYTYILGSIRKLAGKQGFNQENEYKNVQENKPEKEKREPKKSKRIRKALYARFLLLDYALLVFVKVSLPLLMGRKISSARYVYDVAIKFKLLLGWNDAKTHAIIRRFTAVFPTPDHVFLIDIPEQVAFDRKDDVPSMSYLIERRQLYNQIMKPYVTAVLDGTRPIEELLIEVEDYAGLTRSANKQPPAV